MRGKGLYLGQHLGLIKTLLSRYQPFLWQLETVRWDQKKHVSHKLVLPRSGQVNLPPNFHFMDPPISQPMDVAIVA